MTTAERVISAYESLQAVNASEPDSDTDPQAWLEWHDHQYRPASAAYRSAVVAFQGSDGSFHPANVLPAARSARSV